MQKGPHRYRFTHLLSDAQPALTRANRQIRAESLPIYYAETTFTLDIPSLDGDQPRLVEFLNSEETASAVPGSEDLGDWCQAPEALVLGHGRNSYNTNRWHHVQHLNAKIEINDKSFCARLERNLEDLYIAGFSRAWFDRPRCDLADAVSVRACVDELISQYLFYPRRVRREFTDQDQERLIKTLMLLGCIFPRAAKHTHLFVA
jgi:hypothetical protein